MTSYGQYIDTTQPLAAAMTISTPMPHFSTELSTTNAKALLDALAQEGFELNAKTGELSKPDTALRFFVEQNGNRLRFSDNQEFLQKTQLPTAAPSGVVTDAAVTVQVDWRNLSLESRKTISQRGLTLLLPTEDNWSVTYEGLPGLLGNLLSHRMTSLMNRAERFYIAVQH